MRQQISNILLEIAHHPTFTTTIRYLGPMLGIIILLGILYHSVKRIREGYYQTPPFNKKKTTPEILISGMAGGLSIVGMVIMFTTLFKF